LTPKPDLVTNQTNPSIYLVLPRLNSLDGAISLAAVHSLAGLLDSLKNLLVAQGVFSDDGSGLGFEADVVGFDTWERNVVSHSFFYLGRSHGIAPTVFIAQLTIKLL
jgi:hypothetical protein